MAYHLIDGPINSSSWKTSTPFRHSLLSKVIAVDATNSTSKIPFLEWSIRNSFDVKSFRFTAIHFDKFSKNINWSVTSVIYFVHADWNEHKNRQAEIVEERENAREKKLWLFYRSSYLACLISPNSSEKKKEKKKLELELFTTQKQTHFRLQSMSWRLLLMFLPPPTSPSPPSSSSLIFILYPFLSKSNVSKLLHFNDILAKLIVCCASNSPNQANRIPIFATQIEQLLKINVCCKLQW